MDAPVKFPKKRRRSMLSTFTTMSRHLRVTLPQHNAGHSVSLLVGVGGCHCSGHPYPALGGAAINSRCSVRKRATTHPAAKRAGSHTVQDADTELFVSSPSTPQASAKPGLAVMSRKNITNDTITSIKWTELSINSNASEVSESLLTYIMPHTIC